MLIYAFSRTIWITSSLALVLLTFTTLVVTPVRAQVAGATLSGTISDQSGALVPSGQITIKSVATGVTRVITADAAGFYTAPNLVPGTYEITVSVPGFSTEVRSGITLTVGAQQVLNFTMKVGQTSQRVQVTGEAPTVELASSTLRGVVTANTVVELPLNGRSWTDLASLQPGVAGVETQVPFTDAGRGNRGFGAQISISGSRPQQNNYRLDGISISDYANGGPGSVIGGNLGVDGIQEFSVLTSNYSAEYGKTSGGVINAISKSGTNQFHGSAFWFLRDEGFDARNFFDAVRPPFHRNQFGASGGGPIKKDRTFFFGDYEGIRQTKGLTLTGAVPSAAARSGNLCSIPPADGSCLPKTVPVDPSVQKYLGLFPVPTAGSLGNGDLGTYSIAEQRAVTENYVSARLDHTFSEKDSLFGTYIFDRAPFTTPDLVNDVQIASLTKRQIVALEETHIFTNAIVNTVRLGYNRDYVNNNQPVKAINPLAADHSLATVPGQYAPGVQIPGVVQFQGGLNGISTSLYRWNAYQVYDDAFLTRGVHSLKFGFGFERDQNNQTTITEQTGTFGFGSMDAFITNHPTKLRAAFPSLLTERGMRVSIVGGYLQDDWRFRRNLTLNLGLRYETSTVPSEVQGKLSSLRNLYTDVNPHLGDAFFSNPTHRNFEPRIGFAWDPTATGKTAVRGGFGMFDSLPILYEFLTLTGRAYPFFQIGVANNLPAGSFPSSAFSQLSAGGANTFEYTSVEPHPHRNYVMQWNLNVQRELLRNLAATIGYVGARGVHKPFRVDEANLVLPTPTSAGYLFPAPIGSGTKINPGVGSIRFVNWGGSSSYNALQLGIVKRLEHGLQVQGSFTWGKSIDTGSSVIAGDGFQNSLSSLHWYDLKANRALSDFNVGRTFVINAIWTVPGLKTGPASLKWAAGGWELGGVFKANDGVPFTALFGTGGDPAGTLSSDDFSFPDRVAGCNPIDTNFKKNPNGPLYVKTNCFTVPMAPNMSFWQANCDTTSPIYGPNLTTEPPLVCFNKRGNSGRNIMNGPGLMNLDFSIFKNNPIRKVSETLNVQFRAEFFNLLNRANFSVPDWNSGSADIFDATGVLNGAAGLLTTTVTDPREIQFALKVIW